MRFREFLREDGYGNFGDDVKAGLDALVGVAGKVHGAVAAAKAKDDAKAEKDAKAAEREAAKAAKAAARDEAAALRGEAGALIQGGEKTAANLANGSDPIEERDVPGLESLTGEQLERFRKKVETVHNRVLRDLPAAIRRELAQADFLDADQRNAQRISQLTGEPDPKTVAKWNNTYENKPKLAQPWDGWLASKDVGASAKAIVVWLKSIADQQEAEALAGTGSGRGKAPMSRANLLQAVSSKLSLASTRLAELLTVLDVAADKAAVAEPKAGPEAAHRDEDDE